MLEMLLAIVGGLCLVVSFIVAIATVLDYRHARGECSESRAVREAREIIEHQMI